MTFAFNGAIILLVALIAYWWANQGLFSALLHLLCVIGAGAVALALFEPITVNLLLRGAWFDDYAWGVTLVGLFVVFLLIFRVISDKVVYANLNVPNWANFAFGFPVGAAAGILTMGILMLGAGMLQSHREIMGYYGYGRSDRTGQVEYLGPSLWLPVHRWTNEFYNYLSVGSLHPTFSNTPLRQHNPELYKQASLLRDSFGAGKGKLSLAPEAARVQSVMFDQENNRHAVMVEFGPLSRDFGEMLTLSRSQVRLICRRANNPNAAPAVVHPDAWSQQVSGGQDGRFRFDSPTYFATSVPGAERAAIIFEFPVPRGYTPTFIQIRGTRFSLPTRRESPPGMLVGDFDEFVERVELGHGPNIQQHVEVSNSIRPVTASTNQPLGTFRLVDKFLAEGAHRFPSRGDRPARALMIDGIYEPPGTKIVQVHIRYGMPHNIFDRRIRHRVADNARLMLVDQIGNAYSPIGYIHETRDGTEIRLDPARFLPTLGHFPILPDGSTDTIRILFRVTEGVRIRGFMFGNETMGICDLEVRGR